VAHRLARSAQLAYSSQRKIGRGVDVANIVYKIVGKAEWHDAQRHGVYLGSADDRRDGFIHLSFADQIEATAARHFSNRDGLLLIAFSTDALGSELRHEPSRGGALFPHLYTGLPTAAALWEKPLIVCDDGVPRVKEIGA
jgi:uncharacterized protein (DUF952 family)